VIIAIASGKGGTGKTSIATSLALAAAEGDTSVCLLDCDVEEPNCHIFMKPAMTATEPVTVPVPRVDEALCTGCGECGRVCRFGAIAVLKDTAMVFPELCHGCGGCSLVCPAEAIAETPREVGVVEVGRSDGVVFVHGRLNVGEAMSPPVIRAVRRHADADVLTVIDAPPGTSCPVIAAVREADFVVLVTEPTPFGLNDLQLAVEMTRALGIPFGVIVNRADVGDDAVERWCRGENVELLAAVPHDRAIAEAYSRGVAPVKAVPALGEVLCRMLHRVRALAAGGAP
jgi:MinD superfamily P-loop ATPase